MLLCRIVRLEMVLLQMRVWPVHGLLSVSWRGHWSER